MLENLALVTTPMKGNIRRGGNSGSDEKKKKKNEIAHHVRKCIDAEVVVVKNNGKRDLHILPSDLNRVMLHRRVYWYIFTPIKEN